MPGRVHPITGRTAVVTGDGPLADGLADGLDDLGVGVTVLDCGFASQAEVETALAAADRAMDGIDQVVHTWLAPGLVTERRFADVTEDEWAAACERSLAAAWWTARAASPYLHASKGSLVFVVPTIGMAGGAGYAMLAAVAEGIRVLAKSCGRQWGAAGVTANAIATAPHHWVAAPDGDELTRAISLSTPAFGHAGDVAADLAPLVALLDDPDAHFLTAATLVADGGTWMGL